MRHVMMGMTLAAALSMTGAARAADTVEVFEPGAWDLEAYWNYEGLGHAHDLRSGGLSVVVGYGLTDRLSLLVMSGLEHDAYFGNASRPNLGVGANAHLGRVLGLDADLLLEMGGTGGLFRAPYLSTGFELNYDRSLEAFGEVGVYARIAAVFEAGADAALGVTPGMHWRFLPEDQLLLEYHFDAMPWTDGVSMFDGDRLSLGWNHILADWLELIAQVSWGVEGNARATGFSIGFISSLGG